MRAGPEEEEGLVYVEVMCLYMILLGDVALSPSSIKNYFGTIFSSLKTQQRTSLISGPLSVYSQTYTYKNRPVKKVDLVGKKTLKTCSYGFSLYLCYKNVPPVYPTTIPFVKFEQIPRFSYRVKERSRLCGR